MAFVGDPPLFRPGSEKTPVRISVTFKYHKREAERIAKGWRDFYDDVKIGGPAYGDPGGEFTPGRFLKAGCTITMRGCAKRCGWCCVPTQEGPIREMAIKPGWIVQDNNLLACSEAHVHAVFEMLRQQKRQIFFNGGLDKHYLKPWHRELFDSIHIGELWFACDESKDFAFLERARGLLEGIPLRKLRCYTMIGYDEESLADSERRIEKVFELGFMPFCQLYQPNELDSPRQYSPEWKAVQRKWSRPAAYMEAEK